MSEKYRTGFDAVEDAALAKALDELRLARGHAAERGDDPEVERLDALITALPGKSAAPTVGELRLDERPEVLAPEEDIDALHKMAIAAGLIDVDGTARRDDSAVRDLACRAAEKFGLPVADADRKSTSYCVGWSLEAGALIAGHTEGARRDTATTPRQRMTRHLHNAYKEPIAGSHVKETSK